MKDMVYYLLTRNRLIGAILLILALIFALCADSRAEDRKTREIGFLASSTVTASTTYSTGFEVSAYIEGQVLVNVTVEAGTSTLTITMQTSNDNTTYYDHTAFTAISAIGAYRYAVTNFGKYVRLKYVVTGTSFTFAVSGVFKN